MPSTQEERIVQASALYKEGLTAFRAGDQARSSELNQEVLSIGREIKDSATIVRGLIGLARIAFREKDHPTVRSLCAEAGPLWEKLDDRSQVTSPTHLLAESARLEGDIPRARTLYDRSIVYSEEAGDVRMHALELNNKAFLEIQAGNIDEAEELVRASVRRLQDEAAQVARPTDGAYCLLALGWIAARRGEGDRAASLLAASETILAANDAIFDPADKPLFDQGCALARDQLGEAQFLAAWERGSSMGASQALATGIEGREPR